MDNLGYTNPLAPRRVVEVLDRTFRIYRENFIAFVALVAVVLVPITLVDLAVQSDSNTTNTANDYDYGAYNDFFANSQSNTSIESTLVTWLGLLIQGIVINGLITYMASENNLGRKISVAEAFSLSKGRFLPLTGAFIVAGILFFIMFFAVVIASMCVVPMILFPVVGYMALCVYFYIVPVMILERAGVMRSLKRAYILAKRRFWQNFGIGVGIWVITLVLTAAFSYFVLFIRDTSDENDLLAVIVDLAIRIFTMPILPIGLTLIYYDTRIRTEALDIALESVDTLNPRPSDVPSPDPNDRFITGKDVGNIIILTVIFIGFFCAAYVLLLAVAEGF